MAKKIITSHDFGGGARILNLPAPSSANEPARYGDVNNLLAQRNYIEQPARVAETANINIASPGATHDGVALANGDRILLTAQTTPSQNGLYVFNGAAAALTRTGDTYQAGTIVTVGPDGTNNRDTLWIQTTDNPVVDTTALTFTQFGATILAGHGLTLTGNTLALATPVAVADGGTGAGSAAGAKTNLGFTTVFEADFGNGAATSFTITHNLGRKFCHVIVTNNSTNADEDCAVTRTDANNLVLSAEAWTGSPPANNGYHVTCIG